MGFFRHDLHTDMVPKIFFCILGINTHNFVKNDPNFESKDLFDLKFYGT